MKPSTDVVAFLKELYRRMALKSPKFFQVIQAIGVIAALVTGLPLALQQFTMLTGVEIKLPDSVNGDFIRIVFWCGIIVKVMGKLPVDETVKEEMTVKEKKEAMPFTAKKK